MLPRTGQQQKAFNTTLQCQLCQALHSAQRKFAGKCCACTQHSLAAWSSGMILASGARGPGFNSRSSPFLSRLMTLPAMVLAAIQTGSQDTQEYKSTDAAASKGPCLTFVHCKLLPASLQCYNTLLMFACPRRRSAPTKQGE